jgi:uncharacterized protein
MKYYSLRKFLVLFYHYYKLLANAILTLVLSLAFISHANAQVQIRPFPKQGYEQRIKNFVNQIKVVDTHEHLLPPKTLIKDHTPDFPLLLFHYAGDDIRSAGMQELVFKKLLADSLTVKEKWQALKPYWEGSSNTAYNCAALLATDKLFGIKNIDDTTVEILSEKIRKAYQNPDEWFYHVLKEKCNIEYVVVDVWGNRGSFYDPKIFRYATRLDNFIDINLKSDIDKITKWKSTGINTLDDLVSALGIAFQAATDEGLVCLKSGLAYSRILFYDNVKKEKAEEVFNKIMNSPDKTVFSFDEVKPLQDYMMHRLLDLAKANHLPVQFHTGLHAGNGNIIENSKPTHLVNLFQEYPDVKFILFHGGYPYGGELST